MVAVCFFAAWALKLGWIADYLSRPVLIGYIHGVAVVLVVSQLGKLFGLSISAHEPVPQIAEIAHEIEGTSGLTVAIGVVSLAVLLVLRMVSPRFPRPARGGDRRDRRLVDPTSPRTASRWSATSRPACRASPSRPRRSSTS